MNDHEKMEFWNALGRLYDSTRNLQLSCEALRDTAQAHEKRLDRARELEGR